MHRSIPVILSYFAQGTVLFLIRLVISNLVYKLQAVCCNEIPATYYNGIIAIFVEYVIFNIMCNVCSC